jgi:two-component system response regulator MprA
MNSDTAAAAPFRRILLVDDDARTARRLAQMLREDGYEVDLVADGAAAIAYLARSPLPDVLVTDLRLPYADGLAVTQYARARKPGLPVIVVTGYPHMVAASGSDFQPAPHVFTKPLDYHELSSELRRVLPVAEAQESG